eukprot:XP_001702785.1 predicted protein [Chlamydomonas reinhardtii]
MDKLFLSGLLGRRKEPPPLTIDSSAAGGRASPSPGPSPASQQQFGAGTGGGSGSTAMLYSSSAAAAIAGSGGGSATTGSILSALYGGRPPEQLLLDAASCDLVLLVADEVSVTRAVPVHKEVLRARNPGGYFSRLLADPGSFPEYGEGGSAPASGGAVITGHLIGKPIIRRTQWAWPMASALLGFMYRDVCEVTWGQLPAVRLAAEEIGLRGLVGVDESTRLANFVYHARQARPKFSSAVPASPSGTGHHSPAGSSLPAISGASPISTTSGAPPDEDAAWGSRFAGGGGGSGASGQQRFRDARLGLDLIDGVLRSVALDSRVLRDLLLPGRRKDYVLLAGAAANSGAALGSAMGLGGGAAGGGGGPPGVGGMGHGRARRLSSLMVGSGSNLAPAYGVGSPAGALVSPPGGALRASSPFGGYGSGAASPSPGQGRPQTPSRASLELPLLGSRIRTMMAMSPTVAAGGGGGPPGGSMENGGVGLSPTPITGTAGHPYGGDHDRLDPWDALELMVMVPAARMTAALATMVERQLDAHAPQPLLGPAAAAAAAKKAQEEAANRGFNPFSRLTGVPGHGWGRDGSGGAGSPVSGGGGGGGMNVALSSSLFVPTSSTAPPSPNPGMLHRAGSGSTHLHGSSSASTLASAAAATASSHYAGLPTSLHAQLQQPLLQQPALHQLPPASSLGQQDQLSLALALDMGDATTVSQAVAFERRRASVDISANQLNGLAGIGGGGGHGAGGGSGAGGSKGVMGPASPREYFIPLPEHPCGAITITLPLGLVLLISAVSLVTQVLRVAGEQHGVFATPPMRASLRISNPSASMLSVLCQTNTYFAVEPHHNTLYVRKPPADIMRLLQALHSTLPMKSRGSNTSMAPSTTSIDHGPGGMRPGTPSNPLPLAAAMNASGSSPGGAWVAGAPRRGSVDLGRHSTGGPFVVGPGGGNVGGGGGGSSYTSGTPYGQLERLFPGWHMHIVELAPPGVMVDEF